MKAMILAAGLGTRLRPLTNDRPKALVEVGGKTMLEITLARLREFGVRDVIVNAHHFADKLIEYLRANDNFGMHIAVSREETLLDTGGGLKNAAWFFLSSEGNFDEPFVLHNVDVLSSIDLARMARFHIEQNALATLAVQNRDTSRYLLFDRRVQLCGRQRGRDGNKEWAGHADDEAEPLAFSGVHVISPRLLEKMHEDGVFSIIDAYLRLAAQSEKIVGFRADEYYWRDLGRPESIVRAAEDLASGAYRRN